MVEFTRCNVSSILCTGSTVDGVYQHLYTDVPDGTPGKNTRMMIKRCCTPRTDDDLSDLSTDRSSSSSLAVVVRCRTGPVRYR